LRFCLSDLIKIKGVPARTHTASLLKLHNSSLYDGFRVIARKDAAKRLIAMRIAVFELIRAPPR
jgi:hypothetical protein